MDANETLVIGSEEPIKSIEVKDGKARVGAYAIRFSGPDQKDLTGEFFTPKTYLGAHKGDGADVLFNHGIAPTKAFTAICDRVLSAAKAAADEVGVFVEHVLDLADEYEAAIAELCAEGKLKWSSGAASHMVRREDTGEIKRWPIAEFSYTPTPAEPRLPAIAPLKSMEVDSMLADSLAESFEKAVWSTAYMNNLPDSAFLYVEGGGKKDSEGKTVPRSLRHFPVKDSSGKVDMPHLRNALSRIPQSNLSQSVKDQCTAKAKKMMANMGAGGMMDKSVEIVSEVDNTSRVTMSETELQAEKAARDTEFKATMEKREKEISEMYEIGDSINDRESARKFIKEGKSLDEFRAYVLTNVLKAKPVEVDAGVVGMTPKETKSYSLLRAIYCLATKGRLDGIEKEAHEACAKAVGRDIDSKGFFVPEDVTRSFGRKAIKAQNVGTATAGGFLVQTDLGPMIELLRNRPRVIEAGATQMNGLVGDLALPVHSSGATAYWVAETGSLTDSQSVFGQKKLTPHRLGATIPYSTTFLAQSSVDAEAFIRDDAVRVLAIEKDRAALHGLGAAGEPLGIANTTGINATVTYGGAAEWGDVVQHETGITTDNADIGSMAFMLDATTVGKWKTIPKVATYGTIYLIADDNTANGYPVFRTNNVASTHLSFFGVWSQLVLASWAGMEVIVDPYALKKSGQVEITFNELCDILVRQPLAFNVSTDSAAQ